MGNDVITVKGKYLKQAVKAAARFTQEKGSFCNDWLENVWFWTKGKCLYVGSCNGHCICVTPIRLEGAEKVIFDVGLALTEAKALEKALPAKDDLVSIYVNDNLLCLTSDAPATYPCERGGDSLKAALNEAPLCWAFRDAAYDFKHTSGIPLPLKPLQNVFASFPKDAQVFMDYVPYGMDGKVQDREHLLYRFYSIDTGTPTIWVMPMRSTDVEWSWPE